MRPTTIIVGSAHTNIHAKILGPSSCFNGSRHLRQSRSRLLGFIHVIDCRVIMASNTDFSGEFVPNLKAIVDGAIRFYSLFELAHSFLHSETLRRCLLDSDFLETPKLPLSWNILVVDDIAERRVVRQLIDNIADWLEIRVPPDVHKMASGGYSSHALILVRQSQARSSTQLSTLFPRVIRDANSSQNGG